MAITRINPPAPNVAFYNQAAKLAANSWGEGFELEVTDASGKVHFLIVDTASIQYATAEPGQSAVWHWTK